MLLLQRAVFDASERLKVPLVIHVELTLHGDFVKECLQTHPRLRINVPHFRFSRKHMVKLLDRYSALRTDISILGPYIDSDPESSQEMRAVSCTVAVLTIVGHQPAILDQKHMRKLGYTRKRR